MSASLIGWASKPLKDDLPSTLKQVKQPIERLMFNGKKTP